MGGKRIKGNGELTTEQRSLPSFDRVSSHGSFDVVLTTGTGHEARVEVDENLLPYIITEVDGSTLSIRTKKNYSPRPTKHMRIYVTAPSFNSIGSYGSGNITGENLITAQEKVNLEVAGSGNISVNVNAPAVSANISGSGNIDVSGTAKEFRSSIQGSGNIHAGDMNTEKSKVQIAGSGSVEVSASNSLDVNIMGSGDVKYKGNATINSNIAGSGSVVKVN